MIEKKFFSPEKEKLDKIHDFESNLAVNDQVQNLLKENDNLHKEQVESLLDENGEAGILGVWRNDNGEIESINVHLTKEGKGKLGKLLKDKIDFDSDLDKQFLAAYQNNPEVKKIIDDYISIEDKILDNNKKIEEFINVKKDYYKNLANINKFLEHIGSENRIDENINISELQNNLESIMADVGAEEFENKDDFKRVMQNVEDLYKSFSNIKIPDKFKNHSSEWQYYRPDFQAIFSLLSDINYKVIRAMKHFGEEYDNYISPKAKTSLEYIRSLAGL